MTKSTPASTRVIARLNASSPTPTAAPTTSRPSASFVASGYSWLFAKSLTVISPRKRPASSTIGSFSTLLVCSNASASSRDTPTDAVIKGDDVITSRTRRGWSRSLGMTSDAAGSSSTSSNVRPSMPNFSGRSPSLLPTRFHPQSSGEKVSLRNDKDYGGHVRDDPPLDPFADDPSDPSAGFDDDDG